MAACSALCSASPDDGRPLSIHERAQNMSLLELKRWADTTYYRPSPGVSRRGDAEPIYRELMIRATRHLSREEEKLMAAAYSNYATFLIFERNNPMQAYPLLRRSLDLLEKYRDEGLCVISTYTNLSHIYANFNDSTKAIKYLKDGFRNTLNTSRPDRSGYIYAQLLLMSWSFDMLDDPDLARLMKSFLSDPRLSSGRLYRYNTTVTHAVEDFIGSRYQEASRTLQNALTMIDAEYDPQVYEAMTLLMAADASVRQGDAREAKRLIGLGHEKLQGYQEFNGRDFLNKISASYYTLIGRDDLAEKCRVASLMLRDSLYSARNMTTIADLEQDLITSRYNTQLKEAELEQEVLREKNRRQRSVLLIISAASVIIITLLLFLIYKRRKLTECRHDLFLKNVDLINKDENRSYTPLVETPPQAADADSRHEPDTDNLAAVFDDVKEFMAHRKEVFDPAFSIDMMAELTGMTVKQISRSVNRHAAKNFSLFVGDYRVREACRILLSADPDNRPTIESVAERVGYRSRSHFSRTFKAVTGLTTTEFIRQSDKKS